MLYGTNINATGNTKPKYANTASVIGVTSAEVANTLGDGKRVAHAGWVQQSIGQGPVASITIVNAGQNINTNGFLSVTGGGGTGANISYVIGNTQNSLQTYSSNSYMNGIVRATVAYSSSDFVSAPTITYSGSNTVAPVLTAVMGGRAGRRFYETLVASGSMSGNNFINDTYFPG